MFRPAFESTPETAPLTIFYNGTVAVFDVPRDKVGEDKKIMSIQKSPVIICIFYLLRKKIHWELFLRYSTRINFTGGNHFEACRKWTLQVCWINQWKTAAAYSWWRWVAMAERHLFFPVIVLVVYLFIYICNGIWICVYHHEQICQLPGENLCRGF